MNIEIKKKIIKICDEKIIKKWENVWLYFYAFFEKVLKIKEMIKILIYNIKKVVCIFLFTLYF